MFKTVKSNMLKGIIGLGVLLFVFASMFSIFLTPDALQSTNTEEVSVVYTEQRNVIFIHPDGANASHFTAARLFLHGPDGELNWDKLPNVAIYKPHILDNLQAGSVGGAVAHASGIKSNFNYYGLGPDRNELTTITEEARDAGFATALVNSGTITEPGTGVFVANVVSRRNHAEIARQIIESDVDVILGGGERWFLPQGATGVHGESAREDDLDLIQIAKDKGYTVVFTREELLALDLDKTEKLLGLFAHHHTFNAKTEEHLLENNLPHYWDYSPTLAEMVQAAIAISSRNEKGFLLVVEEEGTDNFADGANNAEATMVALGRADDAIGTAIAFAKESPGTLVITAADSDAGGMQILAPGPSRIDRWEGFVPETTNAPGWHDPYENMASADGIGGTGGKPFSTPCGKWQFGISWAGQSDFATTMIARAFGARAELVAGNIDNTDIYHIMRKALGLGEKSQKITIIHTSDFHGRAIPYGKADVEGKVGGLARIATVVNRIRDEGQPVLLLDAGDTIHGTGIAAATKGKVLIDAMNLMGFNAMTVGNHEFNWGMEPLFASRDEAEFPFLSANLLETATDELLFEPYKIIEQGNVKIGILGLSARANRHHAPEVRELVTNLDAIEVASEIVPELREKVDILVVLSHLGHFNDRFLAESVDGIDLILGGHTHWLLTEPIEINDTLIFENGWGGEYLSRIDLTISENTLVRVNHQLVHINDSIKPHIEVDRVINRAYEKEESLTKVIGISETDIAGEKYNPFCPIMMTYIPDAEPGSFWYKLNADIKRGAITFNDRRMSTALWETPLGNFIADAMRYEGKTDIAVQRAGHIREGIVSGNINMDDLYRAFPYDHEIVVYELTGEQLVQLLELSVSNWPRLPNSNFLQVSGVEFSFDLLQNIGERVFDISVNGDELNIDKKYTIAVTLTSVEQVRSLREIFEQGRFRRNTRVFVRDAMAAYLAAHTPIAPKVEDRIVLSDAPGDFTILHTGDIHGHLEAFKPRGATEAIGGISRIASLVTEIREAQPNTILLDAGDTIHGTNIANLTFGESVIAAMNEIGYDAMVVGNHDFNYKLDILEKRAEQANFPILAANVRFKNGEAVPFLKPYTIIEKEGVKIGVIGVVTTYTPVVTHPDNVADLEFLDPIKVTREIVEKLEDKVDTIVLLAHIGTEEEKRLFDSISGITISVSAHTHEERHEVNEDGVILVDSGAYGTVLGRLDVALKNEEITNHRHQFIAIDSTIANCEKVEKVLNPFREKLDDKLSAVIGETTILLDGERANVRSRETNMGNLVADVLRQETDADIAIQNGGGIRANIEVGKITLDQIFTVLPFDNYIVSLELTGEQIWQALENGLRYYPKLSGRFPQVSGMSYAFDPSKPAGERIIEVKIGGKVIDLAKTYKVATNCFMAGGGDGYAMMKDARMLIETGTFMRDAVADYIRQQGIINPQTEGRITKQ